MLGIVATLSEQDIADISAWFAAQKMTAGVAREDQVFAGERLWRAGNTQSGVPACMACHGPAGGGIPLAGYPALAGQQEVYTASMLKRFRAGENWGEKDAPSHVMNGVAAELTDDDIAALASYIQGLHLVEE
jgi:cytochrome c553